MKAPLIKLLYPCLSVFICGFTFAAPPEPKFRHQTIDDKIQIGYGVVAADVDGDKKIDILLADKTQFVWYRNPTWEKFVIAENLTKRDNVCLAAQDLDGDGKCELAVGGDWDPNDRETSGAVFYMIPPTDRTQKWEAVKLPAEPTVHRMRWLKLEEGGWGLVVAPLHGRGKDGVAGSKILLYHMPDDLHAQWKSELLDDSMHATHNIEVTSTSLLVAGREGVLGIRRDVKAGNVSLAKDRLPTSRAAGEVRYKVGFFVTVEPMHGNELVVHFKGARHVLTNQMAEGHALALGKLLKDDIQQIVVGWRGKGGGVRLFTRLDDALTDWRESVVDDKGMACEDLDLADLDGDGDL
ncbi:MAG: hypothetical protein QOE14_267, partial [Humisphaera sp.]|nr:hypothetical protein [Humisphaera sp.]